MRGLQMWEEDAAGCSIKALFLPTAHPQSATSCTTYA
jgi:hypothetical protein